MLLPVRFSIGIQMMRSFLALAPIVTVALVSSLSLSARPGYAFNQAQLDQLRATRQCAKCDLTSATLVGVDLTGADLTGARLTGANLSSAKLGGANLTGADLKIGRAHV